MSKLLSFSKAEEMSDAAYFARLSEVQHKYVHLTRILEGAGDGYNAHLEATVVKGFMDLEVQITWPYINSDERWLQHTAIEALLKYQIGCAYQSSPDRAESYLRAALEIVKDFVLDPMCILLVASTLFKLGALLIDYGMCSEAVMDLMECTKILDLFDCKESVLSLEDIFLSEEQVEKMASCSPADFHIDAIRKMHLNSLKYHWSGFLACIDETSYFESFNWPRDLIDFFIVVLFSRKFRLAGHVLSCANRLCAEYEKVLGNKSEDCTELWRKLRHAKADFSVSWGLYAINLLDYSKLQLSEIDDSILSKTDTNEDSEAFLKISTEHLLLPADEVKVFECEIDSIVSEKEDARKIFDFGRKEFDSAKQYFAEKNDLMNIASINQIVAKLRYFLQCFETDTASKCQLLQESIDSIEELWKDITREQHPELYRDMTFDLQKYCYHMAKLKHESDNTSERNAASVFAYKAIVQFHSLKNEELSERLPDDGAKLILKAHAYYIDSLLLVMGCEGEMFDCKQKARKCYKLLINYLRKNSSHQMYVYTVLKTINQRFLDAQKIESCTPAC